MRIANQKDFVGGLLLVLAGGTIAAISLRYPFGTPARFGAGFFPFWLGITLASIGVLLTATSFFGKQTDEPGIAPIDIRSLALIIGSVVLFGALLTRIGLLLDIVLLVVVSSIASREFRWLSTLGAGLFLAVLCWAVFVYGLGLIVPVLPMGFE